MAQLPDVTINSLRGGFDDSPVTQLAKDACTHAVNVEFFWSALGERRYGCEPLSIEDSGLDAFDQITHLSQWFPINDILRPEYWAVGADPNTTAEFRYRDIDGDWQTPTIVDIINPNSPNVYEITSQPGPASLSAKGKLFLFYPNAEGFTFTHVWDPNLTAPEIRRTGLPQPDPPTVADEGSGSFTGAKRWYRTRLAITNDDDQLVVLSEPSTSVAITPSGTGAGIRITAAAFPPDEAQTDWVVEGSFNNADFYRLAIVPIGTTFYDDTQTNPISFSDAGPLSDAIGAYLRPPNMKYGGVDGDRLVMAGHWDDPALMSRVCWTPVFTDPGVGNDERVPIVTTGGEPIITTLSLDNYASGGITGMSTAIAGSWYVFKSSRIYKLVRTNRETQAYQPMTMSTSRGAVKASVFSGADEHGGPAIFFLDPLQGPSMISAAGLRTIVGVRRTWNRVNLMPLNVCARGVYYPYKRQVHWWLATENADSPNFKLVLQVSELQQIDESSVGRGWSTATGRITEAYCAAILTEVVSVNGVTTSRDRPFIGLNTPDFIQSCDKETVVEDAGVPYRAFVRSAPILFTGLKTQWGVMATSVLAAVNPNTEVKVSLIKNFGQEEQFVNVPLDAQTNEPYVMVQQDNLRLSESIAIQVQFADPD
jgi:hypothetical protein